MGRGKKPAVWVLRSRSEQETFALASRLASAFSGNERLILVGDLGAGKTVFIKGIAQGLGVSPDRVRSPSYVTALIYPGPIRLLHIDLYRRSALPADLCEEIEEFDGVVAVEWGERAELSLSDYIRVKILVDETGDRLLEISATGKNHIATLKRWMKSYAQSPRD